MATDPVRVSTAPLGALLCLLSAWGGDAAAQDGGPVVTVEAHAAETGRPVAGAQVWVQGVGIAALTDAAGRARLSGLASGARAVEVRFLGFEPARSTVGVPARGAIGLRFELLPRPVELQPVKVVARGSRLLRNGFYERRQGGQGTFLTREEIERIRPRYLSDVLRRVAGVSLAAAEGGRSRATLRGAHGCPIQYYVDGVLVAFMGVDEVVPQDVEGIEIYRGAATVPAAFNRGTALCGVIVIWTRER